MLICATPPKKNSSWNFDRDYTEFVGLKILFCVFALGTEMHLGNLPFLFFSQSMKLSLPLVLRGKEKSSCKHLCRC